MIKTEYENIEIFDPENRKDVESFGIKVGLMPEDMHFADKLLSFARLPDGKSLSGFYIGLDKKVGMLVQCEQVVHGVRQGIPGGGKPGTLFMNTAPGEIGLQIANNLDRHIGAEDYAAGVTVLDNISEDFYDFGYERLDTARYYQERQADTDYAPAAEKMFDCETGKLSVIYPPAFLSGDALARCMEKAENPEAFFDKTVAACPDWMKEAMIGLRRKKDRPKINNPER